MKTYQLEKPMDEELELWNVIADDVYQWAVDEGCQANDEGEVDRFFVIKNTKFARKSGKAIVQKDFRVLTPRGETASIREVWERVLLATLAKRYPINSAEFCGYYFGHEGAHLAFVAAEFNVLHGWNNRVLNHLNIVMEAGITPEAEAYFKQRLRKGLDNMSAADILMECKRIRLLNSEPYQHTLIEGIVALLRDGEEGEDAA